MKWRLGLDMGTNSLGWSVFRLSDIGEITDIVTTGVRIMPDGREPSQNGRVGDSLAVTRRTARGMRRNRDRRIDRKKQIIDSLVTFGLMPEDCNERKKMERINPYQLRAEAMIHKLAPYDLGRALFQLSLRRGFKSNRKTGGSEDGQFHKKISALRSALGNRTLGQYLWDKMQAGETVRFRGEEGDFYPDRKMYEDEFDAIRAVQGSVLSDQQWDHLKDTIFFQRRLKPQEIGKCQFYTDQDRAYAGLPIAEKFRIIQEVNNLAWIDEKLARHFLDTRQRQVLFEAMHEQKTMTWGGIRKLKYPDGTRVFPKDSQFNYEDNTGRKKGFDGNKTHIAMMEMLGQKWIDMGEARQNDLVQLLYEAEDEEEIFSHATQWGLNEDDVRAIAAYALPQRTMSVSRRFMEDMTPIMLHEGKRYDEAVAKLGLYHSNFEDGKILDELPYYGQVLKGSVMGAHPEAGDDKPEYKYGKIANPTVHIALNQLRRVVNALISDYGLPEQIHIEFSRELKNSRKAREEISRKIAENDRANKKRSQICAELGITEPSALDLKKIKLWEELGADKISRLCVFSGKQISAAMLFNGEAEIEHILPFSRTLDNSTANLTVSTRQANRIKGNSAPFEAKERFQAQGWAWPDICSRASLLPDSKRWRFEENALERFEEKNDFIARQLTDNAYIARIAKRYLSKICDPYKIVCVNGGLTAMLRGKWGLNGILSDHNKKTREDHRHHAIDAIVIALTDRSMLQRISTARGADDIMRVNIPPLPDALHKQIREKVDGIVVSYKPDHGKQGGFYNDTAYGFVSPEGLDNDMPDYNLVVTKPINALTKKEVTAIRDRKIRAAIIDFVETELAVPLDQSDDKKLKSALYKFGHEIWPAQDTKKRKGNASPVKRPPLKKVRILVANQSVKPIPSAPYKGYAIPSYACCDIYQMPKGKKGKWKKGEYEWKGEFRSYIDMNSLPDDPKKLKPHPAAKFIMRLFKDDMVEVQDESGQKTYMRVTGLNKSSGRIELFPHNLGKVKQTPYVLTTLMRMKMRKIRVSPHGKEA